MKTITLVVILILFIPLFSQNTYLVGSIYDYPDIDFDFGNISSALLASVDGDTIVVYPATYRHVPNVNFGGKNVYVTSLYKYTGDRDDIYNTILDGIQYSSVVQFNNNESRNAVLNGFTITNGVGFGSTPLNPVSNGGGIYISGASPTIINCIIRNNQATYGGGIYAGASATGSLASPLLMGNVIKDNSATGRGGGICVFNTTDADIIFDSTIKNSLFFNNSPQGKEMHSMGTTFINVIVDTFTVASDDPLYIYMNGPNNFSCEHWKIDQIDQDVFVSPSGNDNNSGLSPDEPFNTIAFALQQIRSNPDNRNTIFLSAGVYGATGGQELPFYIKSDVILQGAGAEVTIIDIEHNTGAIYSTSGGRNFKISGIGFINNRISINPSNLTPPILLIGLQNSEISDCSFSGNVFGIQTDPLSDVSRTQSAIFKNLTFTDNMSFGLDLALENATLENIKFLGNQCHTIGTLYFTLTPLRLRGSLETRSSYTLSNILIANTVDDVLVSFPNFVGYEEARPSVMIVGSNMDVLVNNATIVNNSIQQQSEPEGAHGIIRVDRNSSIRVINSICLNNYPSKIYGGGSSTSLFPGNIFVEYSNLEGGRDSILASEVLNIYWGEGNIDEYPSFNWEYEGGEVYPFQLTANSPYKDAGTTYIANYTFSDVDLLGNHRIIGDSVDIGAYEFNGNNDFYVDFIGSPTIGDTPLSVQFTDISAGYSITSWQWDFNDDGIVDSIEQNPTFTFFIPAKTTVRLAVNNGEFSHVKPGYISPIPTTFISGALQGLITSAGNPLINVLVTILGTSLYTTTNEWGFYYIPEIAIGTYSVRAIKADFETYTHENIVITAGLTTTHNFLMSPVSESDNVSVPISTGLNGNFPNPFNPETTISFSLATAGKVEVDIYNIKGSKVKTLVNEHRGVGIHQVVWDGADDMGRNVGSGVYFYRFRAGSYISTRKMLLLK